MRLEFGNKKHIALRDLAISENVWNILKDKVKCPHCHKRATDYFDHDLKRKWIGINFNCKSGCRNSVEYGCEHGDLEPDVYFNFKGKLYEKNNPIIPNSSSISICSRS